MAPELLPSTLVFGSGCVFRIMPTSRGCSWRLLSFLITFHSSSISASLEKPKLLSSEPSQVRCWRFWAFGALCINVSEQLAAVSLLGCGNVMETALKSSCKGARKQLVTVGLPLAPTLFMSLCRSSLRRRDLNRINLGKTTGASYLYRWFISRGARRSSVPALGCSEVTSRRLVE